MLTKTLTTLLRKITLHTNSSHAYLTCSHTKTQTHRQTTSLLHHNNDKKDQNPPNPPPITKSDKHKNAASGITSAAVGLGVSM